MGSLCMHFILRSPSAHTVYTGTDFPQIEANMISFGTLTFNHYYLFESLLKITPLHVARKVFELAGPTERPVTLLLYSKKIRELFIFY